MNQRFFRYKDIRKWLFCNLFRYLSLKEKINLKKLIPSKVSPSKIAEGNPQVNLIIDRRALWFMLFTQFISVLDHPDE